MAVQGPTVDRAEEVSALLRSDDTWLGQLFREFEEGATPEQIAGRLNISTGSVNAYVEIIRALRDGEVTPLPSYALRNAARIRSWLRQKPLSSSLRKSLKSQEVALRRSARDAAARKRERKKAATTTRRAARSSQPGIYVYTYPAYLERPAYLDTGRTLLKVGHSATDVIHRVGSQARHTALPEDPILLRIYPVAESAHAEAQFHALLRAADHVAPPSEHGGLEWFETSTKFLDCIARTLGLEIQTLNESFDSSTE